MGKIAQSVTKSNISVGPRTIKLVQAAFGPAWVVYSAGRPKIWCRERWNARAAATDFNERDILNQAAEMDVDPMVVKVFYDAAESDDE